MKKISMLLFVATFLLISANTAFAHTHLDGSTPEAGETVTDTIDKIELQFDTEIEDNASLQIENSQGEVVEASDVTVTENKLVASFSEPIANGTYTVSWEIIGLDGHIMQESYDFEVNAPEEIVEEDTEEPAPGTETDEPTVEEEATTSDEAAEETESGSNGLLIGIILVAIVAIIAIVLLKRKK